MRAAAMPHRFVGINQAGQVCLLQTQGNPDGHVILRGGKTPNYSAEHVAACEKQMLEAGLHPSLMIDCSHGNSNKDYRRQPAVAESVVEQIKAGNRSITGIMLESHLHEGNQSSEQPRADMRYGVSVTDACIDWENGNAAASYASGTRRCADGTHGRKVSYGGRTDALRDQIDEVDKALLDLLAKRLHLVAEVGR